MRETHLFVQLITPSRVSSSCTWDNQSLSATKPSPTFSLLKCTVKLPALIRYNFIPYQRLSQPTATSSIHLIVYGSRVVMSHTGSDSVVSNHTTDNDNVNDSTSSGSLPAKRSVQAVDTTTHPI